MVKSSEFSFWCEKVRYIPGTLYNSFLLERKIIQYRLIIVGDRNITHGWLIRVIEGKPRPGSATVISASLIFSVLEGMTKTVLSPSDKARLVSLKSIWTDTDKAQGLTHTDISPVLFHEIIWPPGQKTNWYCWSVHIKNTDRFHMFLRWVCMLEIICIDITIIYLPARPYSALWASMSISISWPWTASPLTSSQVPVGNCFV